MLSRFAFRGVGKDLVKCLIIRHQTNTSVSAATACEPSKKNERDYVNFPDPVRAEYPPPHKFGLVPASWFDFFYPKTGVTGGYMFFTGLLTYCLSKEIIILEHHAANFASLVMVCAFVHYKFGDQIAVFYNKMFEEENKQIDAVFEKQIESLKKKIDSIKQVFYPEEFVTEVGKLRKEIIHFQLEAIYRERLAEVYNKVKKSLDYQMALENIEKGATQKNLIDYVLKHVLKSITPEKEKLVLDQCISDLNSLAAKA